MKKEFTKRMKFKNVSIKRRILLSNMSMILVPILIIAVAAPVFLPFLDRFMNVDTVTTSNYGVVSQVQWSVIISDITTGLAKNDPDGNKKLGKSITSLEESGGSVLIESDDKTLYETDGWTSIEMTDEVRQILHKSDGGKDVYHVGEAGLVVVCHITHDGAALRLTVLNPAFRADFITDTDASSLKGAMGFFAGKMGIIILCIIGLFVLTIAIISILTTKGIIRPLAQLRICTNEITNGNLDYEMEYDSTNEFGLLIKDYDQMRMKLKDSMHQRDLLEQQRKEMIAGFSHDLRTPLTSIKGYAEGLMDGIANTPEKQQEYLKTIYTTANDMENLVSELFLFSKLDVDKVTPEKENVAIVNYMADFCEEEKFELKKSDMDISFSHSCDRMTAVSIDRKQFSRVLLNIISNSLKYRKTDKHGHIDVQIAKNEKYVLIKIADNGIGIDEHSLPHVFETFYRADRARSNVRDGSGLGLSICKKIIDLHDGNIWATGALGEGMTVVIALPLLNAGE